MSIDSMRRFSRNRSNVVGRLLAGTDVMFCLSLLLFVTGCGGGELAGRVSGTVTLDGQPLEDGEIGFFSPASGKGASAEIQSDGTFQLSTGLPPATYTVTVSPRSAPPPTPETMNNPPPPSDIPQKYRSPETSELVFEVEDGSNTFEVKLAK